MTLQLEEVGATADAIRADLESAFVRGLSTSTKADRRMLEARTEEWERVGAHHVATRLRAALRAADADTKDAPHAFLSAYTSLHAFERVLSLEVARNAWAAYGSFHAEDAVVATTKEANHGRVPEATPESPRKQEATLDDPQGAANLLDELSRLVEDLVRTGLTSATKATTTRLDSAFKEASRRKLLRLGASLRYVLEEVNRFIADDGTFAARRYSFFLHRSWLLAKGIRLGVSKGDARLVGSLTVGVGSTPQPCGRLELVTVGVGKRVAAAACSFDFRLRVLKSETPDLVGKSLVFSLVFAKKPDVPAEAYLHLPQPQKFATKLLSDKTEIVVTHALRIADDRGGGRLLLGPKSTVTAGSEHANWAAHFTWDPAGIATRARGHVPSPLDLAVELQEEIVLEDWALEPKNDTFLVVRTPGLALHVALPPGEEGKTLHERLMSGARKKTRPRLFGTLHYEFGRIMLSPFSFLTNEGPEHLTLSNDKINLSSLLGTLNIGG